MVWAACCALQLARKFSACSEALPWIVPIPGTRRLSRVQENADSTAVALSADECAELDHLADEVGVAGNRYNDARMGMVGQ